MHVTDKLRGSSERRHHDSGAPTGCADRRNGTERRLPAAKEFLLCESEWETYFRPPIKPSEESDRNMHQALDALGRMLSPYGPLGRGLADPAHSGQAATHKSPASPDPDRKKS